MCISSSRFKFLDITNYLAAGTSLQKFYKAYDVSTPKESFPYEWFESLEKLNSRIHICWFRDSMRSVGEQTPSNLEKTLMDRYK